MNLKRVALLFLVSAVTGWVGYFIGVMRESSATHMEDRYALLGDNRSVSSAVFVHAVVAKDQILGKVIHSIRLWPGWWRTRHVQH